MMILDSNVWIAFFNPDDSNHHEAQKIFSKTQEKIGLPEYVLLEVTTILAQKMGKDIADQFLQMARASKDVGILPSSKEFFDGVIQLYLSKTNKKLSFVDYALLYLSSKTNVVTFDKDLKKELTEMK